MPYIITTSRTIMGGYTVPGERESITESTRRAVATLEKARMDAYVIVVNTPGYTRSIGFPTQFAVADAISEAGGTIGPLPDATVIEVERVAWPALKAQTPLNPRATVADYSSREIIDAYNALEV